MGYLFRNKMKEFKTVYDEFKHYILNSDNLRDLELLEDEVKALELKEDDLKALYQCINLRIIRL